MATAVTDPCDLIVIGSHGRGSLRLPRPGSVTARVLALCAVPVLVHRVAPKPKKKR